MIVGTILQVTSVASSGTSLATMVREVASSRPMRLTTCQIHNLTTYGCGLAHFPANYERRLETRLFMCWPLHVMNSFGSAT